MNNDQEMDNKCMEIHEKYTQVRRKNAFDDAEHRTTPKTKDHSNIVFRIQKLLKSNVSALNTPHIKTLKRCKMNV